MGKSRLGHLTGCVRALRAPVAKGRPEAVRHAVRPHAPADDDERPFAQQPGPHRPKDQMRQRTSRGQVGAESTDEREGLGGVLRLPWTLSLVERVGFEPTSRYDREPDFESGAFDHSATSPVGCFGGSLPRAGF